ncbi:MAG: hypothetical protein HYT76_05670 [Deltaproteobacteria bacterium]|nr:hypothetical protein [Deltaproteobacteria bacterium]
MRNSASTYFTPFGVYRRSLEEARSEINSAYTALESFVGQTMERHYQGTAQTMVGGAAGVVSPAPAARISLGQLMMIAAGVILVAGIVSACIIIYNNCESATDTGGGGGSGHD